VQQTIDNSQAPAARVYRLFAKRLQGRPTLVVIVLVLLSLGLAMAAIRHGGELGSVSRHESTDDAYIRGDQIAISSHIAGYLDAVPVRDNQAVDQGELIALIRDDDYTAKLANAEGELQAAQASVEVLSAQAAVQSAKIRSAEADLRSATAVLTQAQLQHARQRDLADDGATSRRELEAADADEQRFGADREKKLAERQSAERSLEVIAHQIEAAKQTIEARRATRDLAKIDLGYTRILSPTSGQLSSRIALAGQYVSAGTQIGMVVPLAEVWLIANFREAQLANLSPGQQASIAVDSVPGRVFRGTVDSIGPASGALQALLPPDNATGNFTKVAQRFAVKIVFEPGQAGAQRLRPGMSAIVTVSTSDGRQERGEAP
jgi:membrane fusion protein (multidrug efflux system)